MLASQPLISLIKVTRTGQCALAARNYGEARAEALSRFSVRYGREKLGQTGVAPPLLWRYAPIDCLLWTAKLPLNGASRAPSDSCQLLQTSFSSAKPYDS
jgi:hypothetical protein